MNKQITVSLAALVFGTALVSVPAFAQKAANDGGLIATQWVHRAAGV